MQFGSGARGCRAGQRCAGSSSGMRLSQAFEALSLADVLQMRWPG